MFPPPLRCIRRFFCPGLFFAGRGPASTAPVVFPPVGPDALIGPLGGFSAEVFRRLRAATYFARGGKAAGWIFSQGNFAAPAASDFLDAQKVTKKAPGGGANRIRLRLILHDPHPLEPPLRGLPLGRAEYFRRAKSEWRSAISSGPLGPGFAKIRAWCGSTTAPGFSQPTLPVPVRFHRRGGSKTHPKAFPLQGGR